MIDKDNLEVIIKVKDHLVEADGLLGKVGCHPLEVGWDVYDIRKYIQDIDNIILKCDRTIMVNKQLLTTKPTKGGGDE